MKAKKHRGALQALLVLPKWRVNITTTDVRLPMTDGGSTAFGLISGRGARSRNLGDTLGGFRPGVNG